MARTRWEYATLVNHVDAIRQELNNMGKQGWELVSVVPGHFHCTAIFKRASERPPAAPVRKKR
ncbi:MAG: hypothetical protein QJR06_01255 [Alicyclobacillaceae bacterium]|nr:hypothetical protein [Alicyclobacillaceae bacterium]